MPDIVAAAVAFIESTGIEIAGIEIGTATILQAVAATYYLRDQQRRQENAARDAYNSSLRDRYTMVRSATEQRQLVLGRQRVSGPVGFIRSYGTNLSKLVYTVVLAAHEIDAVEAVYFNDEQVVIDGSGNVTGINRKELFSISGATATVSLTSTPKSGTITAVAHYGSTAVTLTVGTVTGTSVSVSGAHSAETGSLVITYQPDPNPFAPTTTTSITDTFSIVTGTDTFTLSQTPVAGSIVAMDWNGITGDGIAATPLSYSLTGTSMTISGGTVAHTAQINYQASSVNSKARVRYHLGGSGQTADATMISNLPGVWTSSHVGTGLAYLVVELDYDETAFSGGAPQVSAQIRGMKCYDPRTSTTAWTENPALLLRAYATHSLGGRLPTANIDDAAIIAAANICDTSTTYTVGGKTFTRPLYTGGITVRTGVRPQDAISDIAQAMGGRWIFADGKLRAVAGAYSSPVLAIDASWLHKGAPVTVQPTRNRADMINVAQGTIADETNDYQVTQYPKIVASAYVTADGAELPTDLNYNAITWAGQAQYVASCQIRYARQGLTVKMTCNMRAYQAEPFDVVTVTLSRFGWSAKAFEVLDTEWTIDGGITLTLKEIDSSIWAMDAGFSAVDPAPNTRLPVPWGLPKVTGLSLATGSSAMLRQVDGTIVPRILATWTAVTDPRITNEGQIEVRWGLSGDAESKWRSLLLSGSATQAFLDGVKTGLTYIVKVRAVGSVANGDWSAQLGIQVQGKTTGPTSVGGLAYTIVATGLKLSWTPCTDVDYLKTVLSYGSTYAGSTFFWEGRSSDFTVVPPADGTYTVWAVNVDTSGNASTPVSLSVSYTAASAGVNGTRTAVLDMFQWAGSAPTTYPSGTSTYTWSTGAFTAPGTPNGWSITPGSGFSGWSLYRVRQIYADTSTSSTSSVTWSASTAAIVGGYGANGATGANGTRTAVLEVYRWDTSTPTTFPTGTSTYTWSTGIFTAPTTPNGWSSTPGAATAGYTLYACQMIYTDTGTSSTSTVTWSTTTAYPVGAAGQNGTPGAAGSNGTRGTLTLYLSSSSYSSGYGSFSSDATSAISTAATANGSTPTTPIKGDTVYFYNPTSGSEYANTLTYNGSAWASPGQVIDGNLVVTGSITTAKIAAGAITAAKINVSQLSAVSADMGTITAGDLTAAKIRTASSGARILINDTVASAGYANKIVGLNASGGEMFKLDASAGIVYITSDQVGNGSLRVDNTASSGGAIYGTSGSGPAIRGVASTGYGGQFSSLRIDQTPTTSSTNTATFSGLLPSGSATSTNKWANVNFNGTDYWVPVWAV